ncbi:MAG: terminase small subunit [Muribaculaceae bacterium]|nr:terminase small subunit [Muribaculaceae bacterium]
MAELTPKQEKFCQEYIQCGNASEAYRRAYNATNMKPEVINVKAVELLKNGKVSVRLSELNAEIKSKAIASAEEIQETLTKLLRGEIEEECVTVEGTGDGCSEARIIRKQVTPKDRIKAGETLAKMRGYYNINLNVNDKPTIVDDI